MTTTDLIKKLRDLRTTIHELLEEHRTLLSEDIVTSGILDCFEDLNAEIGLTITDIEDTY